MVCIIYDILVLFMLFLTTGDAVVASAISVISVESSISIKYYLLSASKKIFFYMIVSYVKRS